MSSLQLIDSDKLVDNINKLQNSERVDEDPAKVIGFDEPTDIQDVKDYLQGEEIDGHVEPADNDSSDKQEHDDVVEAKTRLA